MSGRNGVLICPRVSQKSGGSRVQAESPDIFIGGWLWIQFVVDGLFFAELNEMLTRELVEDGYSGVEM